MRKVRDARVDSTQRAAFACFATVLRHLRIERLSARVAVHSYLTPTRYRCACNGVLRLRACNALEATMKHLKVAATVVNLAIISLSISCSSVPPSPTRSRNVPAVAGHAALAPHLPDAVANGKAEMMSTVSPQQRLELALQLPLRNQPELTQLLHDLYDPKSPNFHKYISVSEFTERFGATAADYNTVVAWAKASGLTVTAKTPNRRLVAVEGSVGTVDRAFHVKVCNYRHPTEARTFYSPDREPTIVGLSVPLLQITGMNNYVLPHPMLRHKETAANSNGSGPSGEYLPSDMRAAYYGNGPLTGAGQTRSE